MNLSRPRMFSTRDLQGISDPPARTQCRCRKDHRGSPVADTETTAGKLTRGRKSMKRSQMLARTALAVFALMGSDVCFAQASTLSKAVRTSESMEPALSFPAQEQAAQSKLDALRARTGKTPNIVWLLI